MGCSHSLVSYKEVASPLAAHQKYDFREEIHRGTFSKVLSCKQVNTDREYAVKIVDAGKRTSHKFAAYSEAWLWKRVGAHPNILGLLDSSFDERSFYLVMKKCEHSLVDTILGNGVEERDLLVAFRQMLSGVEHCHKMNVVHRDINPANFLVSQTGNVKLCDFGHAAMIQPDLYMSGLFGTDQFMSPEMVTGQTYGPCTDIWSFGATAFMMLYGRCLYKVERDSTTESKKVSEKKSKSSDSLDSFFLTVSEKERMHQAISSNTPAPTFVAENGKPEPSQLACAFLKEVLCREPKERPTASQCLMLEAMHAEPTSKSTTRLVNHATECTSAVNPPKVSDDNSMGLDVHWITWTYSHAGEVSMNPTLLQSQGTLGTSSKEIQSYGC